MSGRPSANALAETLVKALAQRGMTVAAAESCTGGMVTAAITSVSGASAVLEYSAVTYANRIKEKEMPLRRTPTWDLPLQGLQDLPAAHRKSRWARFILPYFKTINANASV